MYRDGGLFDLETLIGLWQLRHAPERSELSTTEPTAVLARLGATGLLDSETVQRLLEAHHLLRHVHTMHAVAVHPAADPISTSPGLYLALWRAAGAQNQATLETDIDRACAHVLSALEDVHDALIRP